MRAAFAAADENEAGGDEEIEEGEEGEGEEEIEEGEEGGEEGA